MKRPRRVTAIAGGLLLAVVATALFAIMSVRRATLRRFDPTAITLLRANHERLKDMRTLDGVYVETYDADPLNALERKVTTLRLMRPNFARRRSRREVRKTTSDPWRASPEDGTGADAEFSDGKTFQSLVISNAGVVVFMENSEPAQADGGNILLREAGVQGFFSTYNPETHLADVFDARADDELDFVRRGSAQNVGGIPCQVVTYQITRGRERRQTFWDALRERASLAGWRGTGGVIPHHPMPPYTLRYTLWIDHSGLVRRSLSDVNFFNGPFSINKSEWRYVRTDVPMTPADFAYKPSKSPTPKKNKSAAPLPPLSLSP